MHDLNDMLYFAEVVDHGGFAAAGRALGIPKSKLSRRVAELEAGLGVRLLNRTTRKLSLTEAGETFYRHCAAVRQDADAAAEAMALARAEPRGVVRMVCPVTLAHGSVGRLLPGFIARHPQVRIELEVDNRVVDVVEEGIDIALRVRSSLEDSGSLVVKRLGHSQGLMVATPALLARCGVPEHPQDLQRLPTLGMSAAEGRATWRLVGPQGQEFDFQHRPVYTADDLQTLKYAVLHGTGLCVLPDYMCMAEIERGELAQVLPVWAPRLGVVHAVFASRRGMLPAVRRLLDFLGEHMSGEQLVHCPQV